MPNINFRLIVISDRKLIPGAGDVVQVFSSCADIEGIAFMLREKDLPQPELLALARTIRVTLPPGACLLINSSIETAKEVGCGVHLPENFTGSAKELRKELASGSLIGSSTHSLESALRREHEGVDYLLFGPVYETESKKRFGAPQGIEKLKEVCKGVSVPVFAVGGITPERMRECYSAGAYGGACISFIMTAPSPRERAIEMIRSAKAANN